VAQRWALPVLGFGSLGVYLSIAALGDLRGPATVDFLVRDFLAFGLYALTLRAVFWTGANQMRIVWLFAILFRIALLPSPPTLSDDVYRYIWDGHVQSNGVNPYAYRVDAPELDILDTPQRARVNNAWMASPYLPVAQAYFAAAYRLAPGSVTFFQVGAAVFDLATGLFLAATLRRIGLPSTGAILYLWNPLVIVESAHGAHVDALMTMLMLAALWSIGSRPAATTPYARGAPFGATVSAVVLALATLVKPVPALIVPVLMWRWGWKRTILYTAVVASGIALYAGAGLGLSGDLTGTGVFGATRIYLSRWNFNGGLYHWLEVILTGVQTPGAVPIEVAGAGGMIARVIMAGLLIACLFGVGLAARRERGEDVRLAPYPLAAYYLSAATVNPWYLAPLIAVLPFQMSGADRLPAARLHGAAWLYFSAAVSLSYLTYVHPDPARWGETYEVRAIEYVPLYAVVLVALWMWRQARRF